MTLTYEIQNNRGMSLVIGDNYVQFKKKTGLSYSEKSVNNPDLVIPWVIFINQSKQELLSRNICSEILLCHKYETSSFLNTNKQVVQG